jgi:hypothetical protein
LGGDLGKFVITDAYKQSAKALVEYGFVLLLGEPACGKSTIAAALAVGALDEWGCSTLKVRDADEFVRHSNPHDRNQFFWVDDAFGATQMDFSSVVKWNSIFPHMQAAIRRGAKVVFTSRDYIYRNARNYLKESAFPLVQESQVVIHVERLTTEEREEILYNHLRLGAQSQEFKTSVKPFLPSVAEHERFGPEVARRLGNPLFTRNLTVSAGLLDDFVSRPMELLREVLRTIDCGSRCAIALIFMRGGSLPSPIEMTPDEERAIGLLGGGVREVRGAMTALEGSLVIQVQSGATHFWQYKHPTIRDAFGSLVAEDRELLFIYLSGTPIETLFHEISCGDVGLEGVKVIVPAALYETVLGRIESCYEMGREQRDAVKLFLAHRCSKDFLERHLERNPGFAGALRAWSYLTAVSDIDVLVRLHEFGLLSEVDRVRAVVAIRDLAVETPDAGFLRDRIRTLLKDEEVEWVLEHVKASLLPRLPSVIDEWTSNCRDDEEDPGEYFHDLRSALEAYRKAMAGDPHCDRQIRNGLEYIKEAIEELEEEGPRDRRRPHFGNAPKVTPIYKTGRSIFDDVDE